MQQSGIAHGGFRTIFNIVIIFDDFCADKALFKISVDHAGALRCFPALAVSPRLHLHFAGGDEGFEFEHLVGSLDEAVAAAFLQAHVFEKHLPLLIAFEFGDIGFSLGCQHKYLGVFLCHGILHGLDILVARLGGSLVHVAHIEHRL